MNQLKLTKEKNRKEICPQGCKGRLLRLTLILEFLIRRYNKTKIKPLQYSNE